MKEDIDHDSNLTQMPVFRCCYVLANTQWNEKFEYFLAVMLLNYSSQTCTVISRSETEEFHFSLLTMKPSSARRGKESNLLLSLRERNLHEL